VVLPQFLVKRSPKQENIRRIRSLINERSIHSVCEAASCPNIGECFSRNTLTFMILGNVCTRNCAFCGVAKGRPEPVDPDESQKIVTAVRKLGLDYVVVTSVTRDDLSDGGADHFAQVIRALYQAFPEVKVEVLIPDLNGSQEALTTVLNARPFVLNHNVETVPRLYPAVRPQANYQRSLGLLRRAKSPKTDICTKSGFMVGLGENRQEVFQVVKDLKMAGCDLVTIGQYLAPSKEQAPVVRYVEPEEFNEFKSYGEKLGLKVAAGPFVRSSYRAKEII
jgi:lipoic acid synthetase